MTVSTPIWGARQRLVLSLGVAAAVAAPFARARWTWWLIVIAVCAVGWSIYHWWFEQRGPGAVSRMLVTKWSALHGAAIRPRGIDIHDNTQPLAIRFGRGATALSATVSTRLLDAPVAFRIWPTGQLAPPFQRSHIPAAISEMERVRPIEQRVSDVLCIESNAPQQAETLVDSALLQAALAAKRSAGDAFVGVTWDGRILSVHWQGQLATEPAKVLSLSRPIWTALAGSEPHRSAAA